MRHDERAWMRRLAPRVLVAQLALVLLPACAQAQWTAFLPQSYENHAWIETYGSWERDNSSTGTTGARWDDTFLREKLGVETLGFSYDPRFLQYKLSIAGAGKQEDYESSSTSSSGWKAGGGVEYDARLTFLPEHPYNLQLFATRHEPMYRERSALQQNSILDDYGAVLRYRFKPWFLDANYLDSTLHSTGADSNVKRLNLDGEYFRRFLEGYEFSLNTNVRPSWYDDSAGLSGTSDEYTVGNLVNLKSVRLNSTFTDNTFRQQRSALDRYDADQLEWWEQLSIYLPWHFRTDLTWRLHDDRNVIDQPTPLLERRYSDNGNNVQLDLIHRLFESVDTRYRFFHDLRDSGGGNSELFSHALTVDYTKKIPWGRLLTGVNLGRSELDNRGFASVVNDPYTSTSVPGTVTLHQQNVDPTTILVQLKSPIPPFDTVTLVEGVHYLVNTSVEPFEIQILNLPPEFVVPGSYDFSLSYSLHTGDYDLRMDTAGGSASIEFLDRRVVPFFRYLAQRSSVLSGTYPGVPIDSDSYDAGLRLQYGPLRGVGEFQYLDWAANPYSAWRAEVQYVGTVTRSITAYATTSYLNRHYLGGEPPFVTPDYTEQTETISGNLTKQLFSRNMAISLGGSWSHLSGLTDSDAWSINSSLIWHIGKLDVTLGVNGYGSTSQAKSTPTYDRDRELIFLNLRRELL